MSGYGYSGRPPMPGVGRGARPEDARVGQPRRYERRQAVQAGEEAARVGVTSLLAYGDATPGNWALAPAVTGSPTTTTKNMGDENVYYAPYVPASDFPVNKIGFDVTIAAGVGSTARVVVYSANQISLKPENVLWASASGIEVTSTGGKVTPAITSGLTMSAGRLYIIGVRGNIASGSLQCTAIDDESCAPLLGAVGLASVAPLTTWLTSSGSLPFPDNPSVTTSTDPIAIWVQRVT